MTTTNKNDAHAQLIITLHDLQTELQIAATEIEELLNKVLYKRPAEHTPICDWCTYQTLYYQRALYRTDTLQRHVRKHRLRYHPPLNPLDNNGDKRVP